MTVTAADFEYVRRLVADESALALSEDKSYLVQTRLVPVAEREGLESVGELIAAVRAGEPELRRQLVEALSTYETQFFRDVHPFAALRDTLISERLRANGGRRLNLWSAASSTGQEAYSLAMVLRAVVPEPVQLRLLATDLSHEALCQARSGCYSDLEVRRGLPEELRERHFTREGRRWRIAGDLRAMVCFEQLNLARPFRHAVGPMDIVLLRNVLIYFGAATRAALIREIAHVLRPGGYLLLGSAETMVPAAGWFETVRLGRTAVFRRTEERV
jgi:chemotaxis protein methyltransferase CheR